jgi:beta-ureidopropionase / N-carbamoyl-L-amino-acid hydrolase
MGVTESNLPTAAAAGLGSLRIDGGRLWQSLMDLARIGATAKGGVRRLALTDLDRAGRDLVVGWCRDAGLAVRVDRVGNIFAHRAGRDAGRRAVAAGSHIDTQPSGGRFDGNYGVLAALEVMRTLNDRGVATAAPLELAIWTNEEGTRFTPVMMGSGAWAGIYDVDFIHAQRDADGFTVGAELARIGYAGDAPMGGIAGGSGFDAYFEAHIEQGPILEARNLPIGIVTGALGQNWYDVLIEGMDAHAGPTPMEMRSDAALGAARVIEAVNRIALAEAPDGRGTVGMLALRPNSRNVVPGFAQLSVDFRHPGAEGLARMDAALRAAAADIGERGRVRIGVEPKVAFPPCVFDRDCVGLVRAAANELGLPHMDIVSGAGHDAVHVATVAPTAMIFVPCKDGISHNEIEDALPGHIEGGGNVLLHAMLARAL